MERPPGIRSHADLVEKLHGFTLELDDVLPLYRHRYTFTRGLAIGEIGETVTKFREVDRELLGTVGLDHHSYDKLYLSELIEPPILRATGFNLYVREILGDWAEELPRRRVLPDLWFELTPLKRNRFGYSGKALGLVEIVDTSDLRTEKWNAVVDLVEVLDCHSEFCWIWVLRREIHSPYYSCEFFGP